MEWKDWINKEIFVKLRSGSVYSGKVIDVDETPNYLVFIEILDKFGKKVVFCNSEIEKIIEEDKKDG